MSKLASSNTEKSLSSDSKTETTSNGQLSIGLTLAAIAAFFVLFVWICGV
ncbi:hypothetical protein Desal_2264 [Maridesulfovibrio salexigens DSM 2638]|uniref:Uncharacterized protein n=1 Tax=Maridesulfovibrio salexigens (strain ATCC 14822 / DSM 2638 / NCIMB 8403 / VKM B-1763) TaxID=526222 RepID=C6BWP0_MARSD|nr:hypothetical protein Desal_2264 [Maridesulfovibrio salexigens DSM 2638]